MITFTAFFIVFTFLLLPSDLLHEQLIQIFPVSRYKMSYVISYQGILCHNYVMTIVISQTDYYNYHLVIAINYPDNHLHQKHMILTNIKENYHGCTVTLLSIHITNHTVNSEITFRYIYPALPVMVLLVQTTQNRIW